MTCVTYSQPILEIASKNIWILAKKNSTKLKKWSHSRRITLAVFQSGVAESLFEARQCNKNGKKHKQPVNALWYFAPMSAWLSTANEPSSHLDSGNTDVFTTKRHSQTFSYSLLRGISISWRAQSGLPFIIWVYLNRFCLRWVWSFVFTGTISFFLMFFNSIFEYLNVTCFDCVYQWRNIPHDKRL